MALRFQPRLQQPAYRLRPVDAAAEPEVPPNRLGSVMDVRITGSDALGARARLLMRVVHILLHTSECGQQSANPECAL
jgi:hypothetical protein